MIKDKQSQRNITTFGGLNFIFNAIKLSKIDSFIDEMLGFRNFRSEYSYSDITLSLLGNALCNGDYISDLEYLNKIFGSNFSQKFHRQTPLNMLVKS